jgi:hypothetical protein
MIRITDTWHDDLWTFMIVFHWNLHRMRNVSDKIYIGRQNTHFMFNIFFQRWCHLWNNVEKYGRAEQATDDNMVHGFCMLENQGYRIVILVSSLSIPEWTKYVIIWKGWLMTVCRMLQPFEVHLLVGVNSVDVSAWMDIATQLCDTLHYHLSAFCSDGWF